MHAFIAALPVSQIQVASLFHFPMLASEEHASQTLYISRNQNAEEYL